MCNLPNMTAENIAELLENRIEKNKKKTEAKTTKIFVSEHQFLENMI
jgi:hypothetical protein